MAAEVAPAAVDNDPRFAPLSEEEKAERWPNHTPAQRDQYDRLRIQALKRHASQEVDPVTGERSFGGPQRGSGRPRKDRAIHRLMEELQGDLQDDLVNAIKAGLSKKAGIHTRVKTAKIVYDLEREERKLQIAEEQHAEKTEEELREYLAEKLAKLQARGALPEGARQDYDVDGTAEAA